MTTIFRSPEVHIDFLNRFDVEQAALDDKAIMAAVETGPFMQGQGETVIEPRTQIRPRAGVDGHFNVLRGWIGGDIDSAGTKVVGNFVDNYRDGRPSEYGILTLFDPRNGAPKAIIDATGITEMRTGAMDRHRCALLGDARAEGLRPRRCPRDRILECPPVCPFFRLRGNPGPFAAPGKPRKFHGPARIRPRPESHRDR